MHFAASETTDGVRVIRFPSLGFKHPFDQIFTSFIGTLLIRAVHKVDFIVVSVPPGEPCIGAFFGGNVLGVKTAVDLRDEWEEAVITRTRRFLTRVLYRFYKRLFNAIYRKSSFVATVTPTLVERIRARGVEEVCLLPNGADVEVFHPIPLSQRTIVRKQLGLREDDFVLVYAGKVGWYYRIDVIIRALQTLLTNYRIPHLKFLVVGGGEKMEEYSALSKRFGLEESVWFLGEKRREEVAAILPCCDVGVIPFDDDPIWLSAYTTKFFEYCASGLPTIVSVVKGADLEKLVSEKRVGFVVEPLNHEETAKVIMRIYQNKRGLKQTKVNARKLATEEFNREKIANRLAELLQAKFRA